MSQFSLVRYGAFFCLSASVAFLAACGLESTRFAALQVVLPPLERSNLITESSNDALHALVAAPPAAIGDFDCVAVNIMGPDILPRDPDPNDPPHVQMLQDFKTKNYCSYPGITSAVYRLLPGQTNVLEVPNVPIGDNRIIELVGIKLPPGQTTCPASVDDNEGENTNNEHLRPRYYYIGSQKAVTIARDNNSVTITNEYASITPKIFASVECGRPPIVIKPTNSPCAGGNPPSSISGYQYYSFGLRAAAGAPTADQVSLKIMSIQPSFTASSNATYVPVTGDCVFEGSHYDLAYGGSQECTVKYSGTSTAPPTGFNVRVRVEDANNSNRFYESERYYPISCAD